MSPSPSNMAGDTDVMIDPLHPMHRHLLEQVSGTVVRDEGLSKPSRAAIVFYSALTAWGLLYGLVWLLLESVSRVG